MSCLKTLVILALWSEIEEKNAIKNPLSLCLYQFLKDCIANCIKNYDLFQKIKMFSEIDTQTSWQTNFHICPVIIFVNKIGLGSG